MKKNILFCVTSIFFACQTPVKKEGRSVEQNISAKNVITVNNINESDTIPEGILDHIKVVPLSRNLMEYSELSNSKLKFFDANIFLLNAIGLEFYCYDVNGNLLYSIDLAKTKAPNGKNYKITDFLIKKAANVSFLVRDRSTLLNFKDGKLKDTVKFNFWAKELEQLSDSTYLFHQGYVNRDYGKPHHILVTDTTLNLQKNYLTTSEEEANMADKIGTVAYNLYRNGKEINVLDEQKSVIYQYPDFSRAYYAVDFLKYKLHPLDFAVSSKANVRLAMIKSFWETSENVFFSFFFDNLFYYALYNKKTKHIVKTKDVSSIEELILSNIISVNNDHFVSGLSSDLVKQLFKATERGAKGGVFERLNLKPSSSSVLISFKLKEF